MNSKITTLLDGKCGVCGDEARISNKLFESTGKYATGKIVKTYTQGQEIEIKHSVFFFIFYFSLKYNES